MSGSKRGAPAAVGYRLNHAIERHKQRFDDATAFALLSAGHASIEHPEFNRDAAR
jgi:hypothetical protein